MEGNSFSKIEEITNGDRLCCLLEFLALSGEHYKIYDGFIYYRNKYDNFNSEHLLIISAAKIQSIYESYQTSGRSEVTLIGHEKIAGEDYFKFNGHFKLIAIHDDHYYEDDNIIIDSIMNKCAIAQVGHNYYIPSIILNTSYPDFRVIPIKNNFKFEKSPHNWYKNGFYWTGNRKTYYIADPYNPRSFVNNDEYNPKLIDPETGTIIPLHILKIVMKPTNLSGSSYFEVNEYIEKNIQKVLIDKLPNNIVGLYYDQHFDTYHVLVPGGYFKILRFKSGGNTKSAVSFL